MRLIGHAARMEAIGNSYKIMVGKPEGRNRLEDLDIDGRMLLKLMLSK
jgi:hypothetical protein